MSPFQQPITIGFPMQRHIGAHSSTRPRFDPLQGAAQKVTVLEGYLFLSKTVKTLGRR